MQCIRGHLRSRVLTRLARDYIQAESTDDMTIQIFPVVVNWNAKRNSQIATKSFENLEIEAGAGEFLSCFLSIIG